MLKVILVMYICSTTPGNQCRLIETSMNEFEDMYTCTVYGYAKSLKIVSNLGKDFVNKHGAYTKFNCEEQPIV